jgi:hypothetical protein
MIPSSPAPDKARLLRIACGFLLAAAVLVLVLPLPVPLPVRIAVAATDLIAAAVVWLALRQRTKR